MLDRAITPRLVPALVVASLPLGLGYWLAAAAPGPIVVLGAVCLVVALVPIIERVLRRQFDVLEPVVLASLALAAMYGVRPLVLGAQGGPYYFKGVLISFTLPLATLICLAGTAAFQFGYAFGPRQFLADSWPSPPRYLRQNATIAYSLFLSVTGAGLYLLFLFHAGGLQVLHQFLRGRNVTDDSYFRASTAYFFGAPQIVYPATLLVLAVAIERRKIALGFGAILLALPFLLLEGAQGARIVVLPLILGPIALWFLIKGRRPNLIFIAVLLYAVVSVGLGFLRESREASRTTTRSSVLERSLTTPAAPLVASFGSGTDNDMFESFATELLFVPRLVSANPLDYTVRVIAKPIPRILWPSKPKDPDERLNDTTFPDELIRSSSSTGLFGSFYLAGLLPALLLGTFALGTLLAAIWYYWLKFRDTVGAHLVLVTTLSFIPIILRGNLGDSLARFLFMVMPLLIGLFFLGEER